jgi:Bacterial conjugation TrbI-like protein
MNINERNGNNSVPVETTAPIGEQPETLPHSRLGLSPESDRNDGPSETREPEKYATRADLTGKAGLDKRKLIMLGGGLLVAGLFFAFTAIVGKSPVKKKPQNVPQQTSQQTPDRPKGSVTPLMETVRKPSADNANGQLAPGDIKRTQTSNGATTADVLSSTDKRSAKPSASSLASVPSFSDTQQKWEEPRPYGGSGEPIPSQTQQQQSPLKEPSLVFVRSQTQSPSPTDLKQAQTPDDAPILEMAPGTRIMAKLQTEISSADPTTVVAVAQYTYAIGDQVIVPAGALIFGQLTHADVSGYVGVKFNEIQLADGPKEQIDAVGKALDIGPIKGTVTGKNTGKNFAIRAASGIGSVAAMLVGNNTSSSFSEQDLLRERIAQNIGNAGDSELLGLNANSRVTVSVAAETQIYVVFTKHEQTPSTLHKVTPATP